MINRREFIISITRNGFLVVLSLLGGYLAFKRKGNENCDFDFVCKSCRQNKTCSLDEAVNYRKVENH